MRFIAPQGLFRERRVGFSLPSGDVLVAGPRATRSERIMREGCRFCCVVRPRECHDRGNVEVFCLKEKALRRALASQKGHIDGRIIFDWGLMGGMQSWNFHMSSGNDFARLDWETSLVEIEA